MGDGPDGPRLRLSGGLLDWFSRRLLAWRLSIALEEALAHHGRPEIVDTDQGSQFTGSAFTSVLTKQGIGISMDGKGAWRDNVFVERLWRTIKYEEVHLRDFLWGVLTSFAFREVIQV
jgi:putative transposase